MAELIPTKLAKVIDEKISADQTTDDAKFPTLSSGTSAPSTTPTKVGDQFVDTTNKKLYVATGTTADTDWTILN